MTKMTKITKRTQAKLEDAMPTSEGEIVMKRRSDITPERLQAAQAMRYLSDVTQQIRQMLDSGASPYTEILPRFINSKTVLPLGLAQDGSDIIKVISDEVESREGVPWIHGPYGDSAAQKYANTYIGSKKDSFDDRIKEWDEHLCKWIMAVGHDKYISISERGTVDPMSICKIDSPTMMWHTEPWYKEWVKLGKTAYDMIEDEDCMEYKVVYKPRKAAPQNHLYTISKSGLDISDTIRRIPSLGSVKWYRTASDPAISYHKVSLPTATPGIGPTISWFLDRLTGEGFDAKKAVMMWVAHLFMVDKATTRKIMYMYGSGNDGKTVFINSVCEAIKKYDIDSGPMPADIGAFMSWIQGKRLVTIDEYPHGDNILQDPIIKGITGGAVMDINVKNKDSYGATIDQTMVYITSNQQPKLIQGLAAERSRIIFIEVMKAEASSLKVDVKDAYAAEMDAFLAACIDLYIKEDGAEYIHKTDMSGAIQYGEVTTNLAERVADLIEAGDNKEDTIYLDDIRTRVHNAYGTDMRDLTRDRISTVMRQLYKVNLTRGRTKGEKQRYKGVKWKTMIQ